MNRITVPAILQLEDAIEVQLRAIQPNSISVVNGVAVSRKVIDERTPDGGRFYSETFHLGSLVASSSAWRRPGEVAQGRSLAWMVRYLAMTGGARSATTEALLSAHNLGGPNASAVGRWARMATAVSHFQAERLSWARPQGEVGNA